jgi:type IV pilus assembly protein PilV
MSLIYILKRKYQQGFSLLEVLIALVILAMGMLGIANMLLLAHKTNSSSYTRQQAVQSAYDIIDRIRANRQAAISGNYNVNNLVSSGTPTAPSAPSANCNTSTCSSTQMAAYDTWFWLASDVAQLPNGCGSVTTAVSGVSTLVTVTVQWDDSPAKRALGDSTSTPTQLIIQSQL